MRALLWLDGKIAFSFSYLHKKLLTEWKVEKLLLHKDDSAKTNGFYNNSNVIRIECELRGVGLVPYSAFEASKVRDIRLEPVQHYSYYEDIR